MAALLYTLLLLALTGFSSGAYCVCKDGVDEKALQKTIDYACGSGADCSPIHQKGACFTPDTVKDHCSYAANSYYQRNSAANATCDFSGTATFSSSPPSGMTSTCVYPSSASAAGTSTGTGTGTGTGTRTGNPSMTLPNGGSTTGINPFTLGPSGSSFDDTSAASAMAAQTCLLLLIWWFSIIAFRC